MFATIPSMTFSLHLSFKFSSNFCTKRLQYSKLTIFIDSNVYFLILNISGINSLQKVMVNPCKLSNAV